MNVTTILMIVTVFAALAMIVLTLMQQSKGDMGSAFGGGGSQSMFGSRGSANFLSRATSIMCTIFFVSSLALAYLYAQRDVQQSVVAPAAEESNAVPAIEQSSGVPSIEQSNAIPALEDSSVPATDAASDVNEGVNVEDNIEQLTEELPTSEEVPSVPEQ